MTRQEGLTSCYDFYHIKLEILYPRQVAKDSNYNNTGNKDTEYHIFTSSGSCLTLSARDRCSHRLPKQRPATTLLLSGFVMLLCGLKCGTFLFILNVFYFYGYPEKDLCSCQSVTAIRTSHNCPTLPSCPFTRTSIHLC